MSGPADSPAPGEMLVRALTVDDLPAFQALFLAVFGERISAERWARKYAAGQGEGHGIWLAGQLIAHCGIFYRSTLVGGEVRRIGQLGDLMASPDKAGGLSRRGSPFFQLIQHVLARLRGPDNPDGLAFGFPSERAMRLGERLGLFTTIDLLYELIFPPRAAGFFSDRRQLLLPTDPSFDRIAGPLWQAMAKDLRQAMVGVRDAAYLRTRYFEHPNHQYRLCCIRRPLTGTPVGLIVLRQLGDDWELSDLVAPLANVPRLLRAAQAEVAGLGGRRLQLWLTESYARRFADLAASCNRLEFRIMANPFSSAELLQRFDRRWWLSSGDTDYR